MIRSGEYVLYKNKYYRLVVRNNKYILVSSDANDKLDGFIDYDKDSNDIFVKEMTRDELCQSADIKICEILSMVKYEGLLFPVKLENDNEYVIGTSNTELAERHNFLRTDKYFYEKNVLKSESELIEEIKEIEL